MKNRDRPMIVEVVIYRRFWKATYRILRRNDTRIQADAGSRRSTSRPCILLSTVFCNRPRIWLLWPCRISSMKTVNIAELKNRLSLYLNEVRAGHEVLVRDRNTPIARIVPIAHGTNE